MRWRASFSQKYCFVTFLWPRNYVEMTWADLFRQKKCFSAILLHETMLKWLEEHHLNKSSAFPLSFGIYLGHISKGQLLTDFWYSCRASVLVIYFVILIQLSTQLLALVKMLDFCLKLLFCEKKSQFEDIVHLILTLYLLQSQQGATWFTWYTVFGRKLINFTIFLCHRWTDDMGSSAFPFFLSFRLR